MKKKSKIISIVVFALMSCIGLGLIFGQRIIFVAEEPIVVWDSPVVNPSQSKQIYRLNAGDYAPVSACIDMKHYFVPEIILATGEKGYIFDGKFHLIRGPFWQFSSPLVFSCGSITLKK